MTKFLDFENDFQQVQEWQQGRSRPDYAPHNCHVKFTTQLN